MTTEEEQLRAACAEIASRVRAGTTRAVEEVFEKTPLLERSQESAVELVYTEYATREELGQALGC